MELFVCSTIYFICNTAFNKKKSALLKVYHNEESDPQLKDRIVNIIHESNYNPSLLYCLIDFNGQLQTMLQCCLRNLALSINLAIFKDNYITFNREMIYLQDGGSVALDWATRRESLYNYDDNNSDMSPIVIMKHGLIGDAQSEYIVHMTLVLLAAGYRVVTMISRGCGGLILTSDSVFPGRRTDEMAHCINHIHRKYPSVQLFLISFSLGAALSLQYIAESDETYENSIIKSSSSSANPVDTADHVYIPQLTAALCISPPWDMIGNYKRQGIISFIWSALLVTPLKFHYLRHSKDLLMMNPEKYSKISLWDVFTCIHVTDFDRVLHKVYYKKGSKVTEDSCSSSNCNSNNDYSSSSSSYYRDVEEYYEDVSPVRSSHLINRTPTVVLTAEDDPICIHSLCPTTSDQIGKTLFVVCYSTEQYYSMLS